jgi:hypothetical protein
VETADLEKLTKLIGICAMLPQTKVYFSGVNARLLLEVSFVSF